MMSLRDAVTRCLMFAFDGEETPPEQVRRLLGEGLGGVCLFTHNVAGADQLGALTSAVRAERAEALVAIDEEGGGISHLARCDPVPSPGNAALGVIDDLNLTGEVAAALAGNLTRHGINANLAPDADVNSNSDNPIIGVRSFGSDPSLVARHVAAFIQATQQAGVAACAKHFPGHGAASTDSHLALPVIHRPAADIDALDLRPFRAAISADVAMVMTAHIKYPALDDIPATTSRAIITGLLRRQLGYTGVVITDALEMKAISDTVDVAEGAVRSLAAGADIALLCDPQIDPIALRDHVVAAARDGRLDPDELAASAARIDTLAAHYPPRRTQPTATPDADAGWRAARQAIGRQRVPPLGGSPHVVELRPEPHRHAWDGRGLLARLAALDRGVCGVLLCRPTDEPTFQPPAGRPLVISVHDTHLAPWQVDIACDLLRRRPDAVLVATGRPQDTALSNGPTLATYGAGPANLIAAAEALLGRENKARP